MTTLSRNKSRGPNQNIVRSLSLCLRRFIPDALGELWKETNVTAKFILLELTDPPRSYLYLNSSLGLMTLLCAIPIVAKLAGHLHWGESPFISVLLRFLCSLCPWPVSCLTCFPSTADHELHYWWRILWYSSFDEAAMFFSLSSVTSKPLTPSTLHSQTLIILTIIRSLSAPGQTQVLHAPASYWLLSASLMKSWHSPAFLPLSLGWTLTGLTQAGFSVLHWNNMPVQLHNLRENVW